MYCLLGMKIFSIYKQKNLLFLNIMAMISRLYNRETKNDIAQRKGLRYREDILDNMKSEELIANLFRISQTEQKLKRDKITGEKMQIKLIIILEKHKRANSVHKYVIN